MTPKTRKEPDMGVGMSVRTSIAPHAFEPIGRIRHRKKCRRCYCSRALHPTTSWVPARPYGDRSNFPELGR